MDRSASPSTESDPSGLGEAHPGAPLTAEVTSRHPWLTTPDGQAETTLVRRGKPTSAELAAGPWPARRAKRLLVPEAAVAAAEAAVARGRPPEAVVAHIKAADPGMPPELVGFLAREFSVAQPWTDEASSSVSDALSDGLLRADQLPGGTLVRLNYIGAGGELIVREADLDWVKQVANWRAEHGEEDTLRLMEETRPQDEAGVQTSQEKAAAREAFVQERRRDIEAFKGYAGDMLIDGIFPFGDQRRVFSLVLPPASDASPGVHVAGLHRSSRVTMRYAGIDGQEIERVVPVFIARQIAEAYASLRDQSPPLSAAEIEDEVTAMLAPRRHGPTAERSARMDARAFRHFRADAAADEVRLAGRSDPGYRVRQLDSDVFVDVHVEADGKGKGRAEPIHCVPRSEAEHVARLLSLGVPEEVVAGDLHARGVVPTAAHAKALVPVLRPFPLDGEPQAELSATSAGGPPRLTPARSRRLREEVQRGAKGEAIAALFRRWMPGITFKQSMAMARMPGAFLSPGMNIDDDVEPAGTQVDDDTADMGGARLQNAGPGRAKPVGVAAQEADLKALFSRLELTLTQQASLESRNGDKQAVEALIDQLATSFQQRHGRPWALEDHRRLAAHFVPTRLFWPAGTTRPEARVAAAIIRPGGTTHPVEVPESVARFVADMASLAVDPHALSGALVERGMAADRAAAWEIIEVFAAHGRTVPSPKGKAPLRPPDGVPGALTQRPALDQAPVLSKALVRSAQKMKAQGESLETIGRHLWRSSVPSISMAEAMGVAVAPELFLDHPLAKVLSADQKRLRALGIGEADEQLLTRSAGRPAVLRQLIDTLADERDLSPDQCLAIERQVTGARAGGTTTSEGPSSFARRYQRPVAMLLSEVETAQLTALAGDDGGLRAMLQDLSEGGRLTESQREALHDHFFWKPAPKPDRRLVMPPAKAGQAAPTADLAIPAHLADTIRLMTECNANPRSVVDTIQRTLPSLDDEDALAVAKAFRVLPKRVEREIVEDGEEYTLDFASRLKDEATALQQRGLGSHFILHRLRQLEPCPSDSSPEEHDSYLRSLMALDQDDA